MRRPWKTGRAPCFIYWNHLRDLFNRRGGRIEFIEAVCRDNGWDWPTVESGRRSDNFAQIQAKPERATRASPARVRRIIDDQDILAEARNFAKAASMAATGLPEGPCPPIIACAEAAVDKICAAIDLLQEMRDAEPGEGEHA
jgi:hypothetical protein